MQCPIPGCQKYLNSKSSMKTHMTNRNLHKTSTATTLNPAGPADQFVDESNLPLAVNQDIGLLYCTIHREGIPILKDQNPGLSHLSKKHTEFRSAYTENLTALKNLLKQSKKSVYIPNDTPYNPVDVTLQHAPIGGLAIEKGLFCQICNSFQVLASNPRALSDHIKFKHQDAITIDMESSSANECYIQRVFSTKSLDNPYFRVTYEPPASFTEQDSIDFYVRSMADVYNQVTPNSARKESESIKLTNSLYNRLDWSSKVSLIPLKTLFPKNVPVPDYIVKVVEEYVKKIPIIFRDLAIDYRLFLKSRGTDMTLPESSKTWSTYQDSIAHFTWYLILLYNFKEKSVEFLKDTKVIISLILFTDHILL